MVFGLATGVAVVAAALARRPLLSLLDREFRYLSVLWIGVALHLLLASSSTPPLLSFTPSPSLAPIGGLLYVTSLWLLVAFSLLNMQVLGVRVIGIGLLLNTAVIALNGGQMPVHPGPLSASGIPGELQPVGDTAVWSAHTLVHDDTLAALLGDWIHVSIPFGDQMLLSPGDLVIVAGILLFFMVIPEADDPGSFQRVRERIDAISARIG